MDCLANTRADAMEPRNDMQNLVSFVLTETELAEIDAAIATLRRYGARFPALAAEQRRQLPKLGDASESFTVQTLAVLAANPQIVPPSLDVAEAQNDLLLRNQLRPRAQQVHQVLEAFEDAITSAGSDAYMAALEGYALLRVSGKGEALKAARRALSVRFKNGPKAKDGDPAA